MKPKRILYSLLALGVSVACMAFYFTEKKIPQVEKKKRCVFNTVMGQEKPDSMMFYAIPEKAKFSIKKALIWMAESQQTNGGWGSGSHSYQQEMNPHAVHTDPATTAMVAMSLLRNGNTLQSGPYAQHLNKALLYLMTTVEQADPNALNITNETGTQIQTKLGQNIDVVLTTQFFTNVLDYMNEADPQKTRVKKCLSICVTKIQNGQDSDGGLQGAGWAGVLQSSFANNALESAQSKGVKVDTSALNRFKNYQKNNLDVKNKNVKTEKGAGIILYSVSGSTRAAATEAREAEEVIRKAKKEGKLDANAPVNADNLQKAGMSKSQSMNYSTSYDVYQSGKAMAQDSRVMTGFGNNGGEEFLSYLQTGESMIIGKDNAWKKWYDTVSGTLMNVQNDNGSWSGHHCITSPVFCTATCLLILSVNNDLEQLMKIGETKKM